MVEVGDLLRQLSEVQKALLALPDDAFADKYLLNQRRDELRAAAAEARANFDTERPSDDLRSELKALRNHLRKLDRQKIDLVGQAGSDQMSGLGGVQLNTAISAAQGAGSVQARISRIEGILIDRGEKPPL
jgi:hypothetical protein